MGLSGHRRYSPIGIDCGATRLKAVQRARSSGAWRVSALASVPRSNTDQPVNGEELAAFVGVLRREGFVGRQTVLAAPADIVKTTILELPPRTTSAPVDQIARMEAARLHGREGEGFEVATWDLPAGHRGAEATHVMATTCAHADAEPLLAACDGVGLDVVALEPAASALARACRPWCEGEQVIGAVADLGWSTARLMVMHRGVPVYQRTVVDGGLRALRDALAQRLALDVAAVSALFEAREELQLADDAARQVDDVVQAHAALVVAELQAAVAYASHRYPQAKPGPLVLTGGAAATMKLGERIGAAAGMEPREGCPARLMTCPTPMLHRAQDTALTVATGLSAYLDD